MPPKLREFALGGLWYRADPPLKPMSGPVFEKWRADWEMNRWSKAAWEASTSGGLAPPGGEEAEEGEDPLFLQALAASLKDDADKKRAEEEEKATAIAAVKEMEAREAEENTTIIFLDD